MIGGFCLCVCVCDLQGYQGMVDGGDNIKEAKWESVSSMLQVVSVMRIIRPLRALIHTSACSVTRLSVTIHRPHEFKAA